MPPSCQKIAVFDARSFFEKALAHGVRNGIIDQHRVVSILNDAPKGMLQIAEYFGTQYLRPNIEEARTRIVNLVSLFLADRSGGDLDKAARSLRDHTFLSHSRGGSEMIKALWALPDCDIIGGMSAKSQREFLAEWSLREPAEYRIALEQRKAYHLAIEAALWFAENLGVAPSSLSMVPVGSFLRTAMLVYLGGNTPPALPNAAGLVSILKAIRKKGIAPKGRKRVKEIFQILPESYQEIARRHLQEVETEDLPRILDSSLAIDKLFEETVQKGYFLRDVDLEDASLFDAAVSKEWQKMTAGKTDDDSLLTIFVCIAADTVPKPALTRSAARALIRKVRADGLKQEPVLGFIRQCAPHEMQEGLEKLWNEFFPEAQSYLLDSSDTTLGEAVAFLKEHCYVM